MVVDRENPDLLFDRHFLSPHAACAALDPVPERPFRDARIRDLSRRLKFDLSTGARIAPDAQLTADVLCPLPHSGQSPMALPSAIQNLPIDARTIVPHPQAKACTI